VEPLLVAEVLLMLPAIPEHVLKHAPWSISKAGVIEKCSQQFDYKYVQKLAEIVTFEQSRLGVAVHAALEMVLGGTDQKKAFLIAGDNGELTTDELEQLQTFWDQVSKFKRWSDNFQKQHGVAKKFIEQKWAVKPDFTGTEFFDKNGLIRGVVDFAMLTGKKDLVVIDHKSGKVKEIDQHSTQLKTYAVMALAVMPDIRGVQSAINYVMHDKMDWAKFVPAEQIRDEFQPWLVNYLTSSCEKLLAPPQAKKGWYCDWCAYKPICPLFKKETVSGQQEAK
jgi:CRISPR/Cas system-associated exonuclease Cas4 (RecB family)